MSLYVGLPPEINSARMYSGPGSESMLAAAAAWNAVSAEMRSAAIDYGSVIAALTSESWFGPSSTKMSAAVAPFVEWLNTTAAQAEQAGTQANAAAAAYEAAFAATVPPAAVAANRTQLTNLLASNIFGQNAGLIAANEVQYGEMWAQDAAAMTNYSAASRAATEMTPFQQPQSDTTSDGTAQQAAAVVEAAPSGSSTSSGESLLEWLGLAPNTNTSTTGLAGLMNYLDGSNGSLLGIFLNNASVANFSNAFTTSCLLNPTSFVDAAVNMNSISSLNAVDSTTSGLGVLAAGLGGTANLASVTAPGAAAVAGVGQASLVGALSVPPAWGATGAAITPVAATTQVGLGAYHGFGSATPMVMEEAKAVGMPGVPLAGIPGGHEEEFAEPMYGFRLRIMGRPPAAG